MMAEDLSGQKFGRLSVVSMNGKAGRNSLWLCRCECGAAKTVRGTYLKTGHTASCGCWSRELTTRKNRRHGDAVRGHRTPEYRSWSAMIRRCHVERLQDITEQDCEREGVRWLAERKEWEVADPAGDAPFVRFTAAECFAELWCGLHGDESWRANPEIVALTFTVHKQNIDALPKEIAA